MVRHYYEVNKSDGGVDDGWACWCMSDLEPRAEDPLADVAQHIVTCISLCLPIPVTSRYYAHIIFQSRFHGREHGRHIIIMSIVVAPGLGGAQCL